MRQRIPRLVQINDPMADHYDVAVQFAPISRIIGACANRKLPGEMIRSFASRPFPNRRNKVSAIRKAAREVAGFIDFPGPWTSPFRRFGRGHFRSLSR